ncbi:predicted protein [Phaeodactylum tricornutum CCAP 1055/1]|uniref:Fibronectin type-III domain-containing protein n=2 Tax=Phaeodactylum tricornutum TaxID=2850 RepID=B7FZX1_PHATC|nr:predicted protein [Phaeodactylum tricornutum CCAP 1055/1]EEC47983.1 predicted protein [Phaeodactylum tricornutum CCAP 1055/1]|eukprot:XP_002180575.1 predicted protein [Phaeodactylum tricornutum CCAP 1055/1]
MSVPKAPTLNFIEASETTIVVEFDPSSDAGVSYILQWKDHSQPWSAASTKTIRASSGKTKAEAEPLEPGTTYCVRLMVRDASGQDGEPSPQLVLDTEQVGCTPKADKACCILL